MTIGLLTLSVFLFLNNQNQGPREKLIGVWIPDIDGYDYRIEIQEDGLWREYHNQGKSFTTYSYTIETNPECSRPVNVKPGLYYIKMIEKPGPLETVSKPLELCYEIDGVSEERLSLLFIGGANLRPMTFKRFVPQQGD